MKLENNFHELAADASLGWSTTSCLLSVVRVDDAH